MRPTSFPGLVDSARAAHASSHLEEAAGAARALTTAHPTPNRRHRDRRSPIARPAATARRVNVPRRRSY